MQCEVCEKEYRSGCTNRRCMDCHNKYCTPGGSTSPGHGYGNPPTKEAQRLAEDLVEDMMAEFKRCGVTIRKKERGER